MIPVEIGPQKLYWKGDRNTLASSAGGIGWNDAHVSDT
jgi:hypothetical protein